MSDEILGIPDKLLSTSTPHACCCMVIAIRHIRPSSLKVSNIPVCSRFLKTLDTSVVLLDKIVSLQSGAGYNSLASLGAL